MTGPLSRTLLLWDCAALVPGSATHGDVYVIARGVLCLHVEGKVVGRAAPVSRRENVVSRDHLRLGETGSDRGLGRISVVDELST